MSEASQGLREYESTFRNRQRGKQKTDDWANTVMGKLVEKESYEEKWLPTKNIRPEIQWYDVSNMYEESLDIAYKTWRGKKSFPLQACLPNSDAERKSIFRVSAAGVTRIPCSLNAGAAWDLVACNPPIPTSTAEFPTFPSLMAICCWGECLDGGLQEAVELALLLFLKLHLHRWFPRGFRGLG